MLSSTSTGIKKLQEDYKNRTGIAPPIKKDILHWLGNIFGPNKHFILMD